MSNQSQIQPLKVVLIGEILTGKTSIISKLIYGTFFEKYKTTSVPQETTLQYASEGNNITINFWDTCGQEKYRVLNKIFYKNAQVVFFVYSITDRKSFEEIDNYWINEIEANVGDSASKKIFYDYIYSFFFNWE